MQSANQIEPIDPVTLVERSFDRVKGNAGALVARFYTALFSRNPELRPLFPEDMSGQQKKLAGALGMVVATLRKPDVLGPVLEQLGERHVGYGARAEHFDAVGAALLSALGVSDPDWDAATEGAWGEAYGAVVDGMMRGMLRHGTAGDAAAAE